MKRFAEHKTQLIIANIEDPSAEGKLVCTRCGHEEPISPASSVSSPVYHAVRAMERVPCALADLDEKGYLIAVDK